MLATLLRFSVFLQPHKYKLLCVGLLHKYICISSYNAMKCWILKWKMKLSFQTFQENKKLSGFFSLLSTNVAENGAHFVSTIEGYSIIWVWKWKTRLFLWSRVVTERPFVSSALPGKSYPFYGVQWHPEVNCFQWNRKFSFPHSTHAVRLSSQLAEFLINEGEN